MGFFQSLAVLAVDIVKAPVAVVKDVVTMGGVLDDRKKSYTAEKLEDIADDIELVAAALDGKEEKKK